MHAVHAQCVDPPAAAWIHTMIPDPKHGLAVFPILSIRTHAGHLNVDTGRRTRDVVIMD